MMDNTKGLDVTLNRIEAPACEPSSTCLVAGPVRTALPNRSLAARSHRSRKGFATGKPRLSLKIPVDSITAGEETPTTGQSTPASTSSSCGSDVVPWWEVEYQCPPPGHLGAHAVPVSTENQAADSPSATNSVTRTNSMTRLAETNRTRFLSVELSTPTQTETTSSPNIIRPGVELYETSNRARRGPYNKLSTILASAPCLLVDSSPSQKRKMRPQDLTDCNTDLFFTPVTKERKRVHESSLKTLPSQVVTPSALMHPLTLIGISQTCGPQPASKLTEKTEDDERPAP